MDGDIAKTNPFIELRENGGHYIDKTMLVQDVVRHGSYIVCLRPHGNWRSTRTLIPWCTST